MFVNETAGMKTKKQVTAEPLPKYTIDDSSMADAEKYKK
jgi:hypothetical protein